MVDMDNNIHPLRIEEIKKSSMPFPLFYYEHGDPEFITQAIYVTDIGGSSPLVMPQSITLSRETGVGSTTIGIYQLVSTVKDFDDQLNLNPLDN